MKPDDDYSELLSEATVLTMQGRAALAEGNGRLAYQLLSRKHDLVLRVFGPTAGATGTSLIDLAEALHLIGRMKEARAAINDALSIYQRLDRTDMMLDRLEHALIDICTRQGHSFEVERISRARVKRMSMQGAAEKLSRAIEQDELAMLYMQQRRYDEALTLLLDSLSVFEQASGPEASDTGTCCMLIARVLLQSDRYEEAEPYGRRALQCAKVSHGEDSIDAAMVADELAVTLAFCAQRGSDAAKAREALLLSDGSLRRFLDTEGPHGKEAARSAENNRKLKRMLGSLVASGAPSPVAETAEGPIALPTFPFISHSYADQEAVTFLLGILPDYIKPVIFEAINVPPSEFVSEKLISGLMGADGFISIDSPISNSSFWTAFERDLATRKQKRMFRFDPETRRITAYQAEPRHLWIAHLYHQDDSSDVRKVLRWLVDERSFEAFNDPDKFGEESFPPFSEIAPDERDMRLFSFRSFGAIYVLFLSQRLLDDDHLLTHAAEQALEHPQSTMICWLDPPEGLRGPAIVDELKRIPKDRVYAFSKRPSDTAFNIHELDDLMVRLYWLVYQSSPGDWSR